MNQIRLFDELFPVREINFDFGLRLISTERLNDMLLDENGNYTSIDAEFIDENIFYFTDEFSINLDEISLISKIISEI